jgi:C_GCAxxG_C_C family probable redox protein
MDRTKILSLREEGYNCAETLLRYANDRYGLDLGESSFRLMSGFGGGVMTEDFCGAITGAVAALSALYSRGKAHDSPTLKEAIPAFLARLNADVHPSTNCAELKENWRTEQEGCTPLILAVAETLEKFLAERGIVSKDAY